MRVLLKKPTSQNHRLRGFLFTQHFLRQKNTLPKQGMKNAFIQR